METKKPIKEVPRLMSSTVNGFVTPAVLRKAGMKYEVKPLPDHWPQTVSIMLHINRYRDERDLNKAR